MLHKWGVSKGQGSEPVQDDGSALDFGDLTVKVFGSQPFP